MKKKVVFFALAIILCSLNHLVAQTTYKKTSTGLTFYFNSQNPSDARTVQLNVLTPGIIHVVASPQASIPDFKSLVVLDKPKEPVSWKVVEKKDEVVLQTSGLQAQVSLRTGAVSFFDAKGNRIAAEKTARGRWFDAAVHEGESSYQINQAFQSAPDEAYYGLGQHQDGLFNYKGYQVNLFQNNTEVAVPFLISNKNYGILWDNYSLTRVGDIRTYRPLSALKLFSKEGDQGWLTAIYKNKDSAHAITRAESLINLEYLNDSKLYLPKAFRPEDGTATWEGSIASGLIGVHKLRFTYAGYVKVWLDGKLVLDRWRQSWNPGSAIIDLNMKSEEKHPIKVEWLPDGGESYISLKWLEPLSTSEQNQFAFSSEAGKRLDYYFVHGKNMDEVISGYRKLTGKATILPKWAFGFWQSRERYKTQEEVLSAVKEFRKRKIPLDNIVLDWSYWKENDWGSQEFDATRFSNPDSMIKVLHNQYNTRFMISVWPKFYEGITAYNEFAKKGWLYKRNIADRQRDWIAQGYISTFYDAFNVDAQKGFWDLMNKKLYSKGVDAWWMDASEPDILSNVSPEKRKEQMSPTALGPAAEYLNAYPLQNAKGIYEGQRSVNPNDRVFILTRSGFAGSQRYAAAIWSGDISSRWHDMELQISAGVNFSMSGIPYWTMDIGGFAVERRYERPNQKDLDEWREQMTRWYQYGAFCPLFRVHGQFPFREIYNTAPEDHPAYKSMLYYNKLRYRLMPYIYSIAGKTYHENYTMMRGLVMDFPADKNVLSLGDQYLFGPSLLVNPVYTYKATNRKLYLPATTGWYDLYTGKYLTGGKAITADAPYERMPVYVKEGSIIPFGPEMQYTSEKKADTITLYVYRGKNAEFTLYEDEDTNYNYEKGLYSTIPINYNEAAKTLTIGDRKGSFPGMLQQRVFRIVSVSPSSPRTIDFERKADKEMVYSGKALTVKM